jgi:hypothetical protein
MWGGRRLGSESLPAEALSGVGSAPGPQQHGAGLARGSDGPLELRPLLLALALRRSDAVGVMGLGERGPPALGECGRLAWAPPAHGGVSDGDASCPPQGFDLTIPQGRAHIPPHATHAELTRQVTPCAEWGLVQARSAVI